MEPPTQSGSVWTPERQAKARKEASRWAGTKHQNRLALPGEGIDCVHFVFEVVIAAGICPRFPIAFYDERLGALRERNIIEDLLLSHLHAESHPPDEPPAFGDLVVAKCGRQTNHVGIILDGEMWHVPGRGRVGPAGWADWKPRTQSLVRITETGFIQDPAALTWAAIKAKTA